MKVTEEQRKELAKVCEPLMEWLANPDNCHPHVKVIVDSGHVELVEGICTYRTNEFVKD